MFLDCGREPEKPKQTWWIQDIFAEATVLNIHPSRSPKQPHVTLFYFLLPHIAYCPASDLQGEADLIHYGLDFTVNCSWLWPQCERTPSAPSTHSSWRQNQHSDWTYGRLTGRCGSWLGQTSCDHSYADRRQSSGWACDCGSRPGWYSTVRHTVLTH